MFGIEDDRLIEGLEALRDRLCCYMGDTCDCKYGINAETRSGSEQTGCPEIRLAITYLKGQFEQIYILRREQEVTAAKTLAEIRRLLDAEAAS